MVFGFAKFNATAWGKANHLLDLFDSHVHFVQLDHDFAFKLSQQQSKAIQQLLFLFGREESRTRCG